MCYWAIIHKMFTVNITTVEMKALKGLMQFVTYAVLYVHNLNVRNLMRWEAWSTCRVVNTGKFIRTQKRNGTRKAITRAELTTTSSHPVHSGTLTRQKSACSETNPQAWDVPQSLFIEWIKRYWSTVFKNWFCSIQTRLYQITWKAFRVCWTSSHVLLLFL